MQAVGLKCSSSLQWLLKSLQPFFCLIFFFKYKITQMFWSPNVFKVYKVTEESVGNWFGRRAQLQSLQDKITGWLGHVGTFFLFVLLIHRQRKMSCKSTCDWDLEKWIKVSSVRQTHATVATLHLCSLKVFSTRFMRCFSFYILAYCII